MDNVLNMDHFALTPGPFLAHREGVDAERTG